MSDSSLFRIKTDGTSKSKLSDTNVGSAINIIEDGKYRIIYINDFKKGLIKVARVIGWILYLSLTKWMFKYLY